MTPGVVGAATRAPHRPAGDADTGPLVSFARSGVAAHWNAVGLRRASSSWPRRATSRCAGRAAPASATTARAGWSRGRSSTDPEPLDPPAEATSSFAARARCATSSSISDGARPSGNPSFFAPICSAARHSGQLMELRPHVRARAAGLVAGVRALVAAQSAAVCRVGGLRDPRGRGGPRILDRRVRPPTGCPRSRSPGRCFRLPIPAFVRRSTARQRSKMALLEVPQRSARTNTSAACRSR